jgi:2-keto-4-pentenoate hydratase/2-oxohepta-3-ene-1,7-dioic acid hydratase in catechol pathway
MRLLTYDAGGGSERLAVAVDADRALDVEACLGDGPWTVARLLADALVNLAGLRRAIAGSTVRTPRPIASLRLLPPIGSPGKLVAVGRNYREHAAEEDAALPEAPLLFAKLPSALVGHDADVIWSRSLTAQADYEAELAVVIGRRARQVEVADALDHVLGYSCLNDVSLATCRYGRQWTRAKSLDTFCPMGPRSDGRRGSDPGALRIRCRVNGELRQDATTGDLVHGIAELIAYCSRSFTLEPGDVIATGTPGGVGAFRDPPSFLADGDLMEVDIQGIGVLRNRCRVVD